jgi:hypothetical protein
MSTNSRISLSLPNTKRKSIYCHWDGSPEHQLPILRKHYNTTKKAKELIELGDISYLAPRVKPEPGEIHTFNDPAKDENGHIDVTIAYHRDRGEDLEFTDVPQQYNYVFDGKKWKLEEDDD